MNYEELYKLKKEIDLLIDGIDPQSMLYVGEDSILSSNYNKSVLKNASSIIDKLIKYGSNPDKKDYRRKYNFYLPNDVKDKIAISDTPVSISEFTYKINEMVDSSLMKKIKATTITSWLFDNKYLCEIKHEDGNTFKIVTEKGKGIGIIAAKKTSQYGRVYDVNLYSADAQKFIVDNLDAITEHDNMKIRI